MCQLCFSLLTKFIACVLRHPKWATTAFAIVAAAGAYGWQLLPQTYSTEAGEWRWLTLADGSVARMGPRTKIAVKIDGGRRSIVQFRGEATYRVTKDPNRPFRVEAGDAMVEAIGTQFSVSRSSDAGGARVAVIEGAVSVSRPSVSPTQNAVADIVLLNAGYEVLAGAYTLLVPNPVNVKAEVAKSKGRIFFDGVPVTKAIEEFNKRHRRQISIPGHLRDHHRVVGEFDLDDPEKFVQYLETSPALQPSK